MGQCCQLLLFFCNPIILKLAKLARTRKGCRTDLHTITTKTTATVSKIRLRQVDEMAQWGKVFAVKPKCASWASMVEEGPSMAHVGLHSNK